MANLSASEIRRYAAGAGFAGDDLNKAVAIALAESGGNPNAHNDKGKDDSYGLWQINMLGSLGPDRRKRYKIAANTDLFKPEENARVAYAIYKDNGGFKPWTTFTSGRFQAFMNAVQNDPGLVDTARNGFETVTGEAKESLTGPLNALGNNIFTSMANTSGVLLAALFIVAGVVVLILSSANAKKAASLLPAGKVKKVVGKVAG